MSVENALSEQIADANIRVETLKAKLPYPWSDYIEKHPRGRLRQPAMRVLVNIIGEPNGRFLIIEVWLYRMKIPRKSV